MWHRHIWKSDLFKKIFPQRADNIMEDDISCAPERTYSALDAGQEAWLIYAACTVHFIGIERRHRDSLFYSVALMILRNRIPCTTCSIVLHDVATIFYQFRTLQQKHLLHEIDFQIFQFLAPLGTAGTYMPEVVRTQHRSLTSSVLPNDKCNLESCAAGERNGTLKIELDERRQSLTSCERN
jgi:hypothetical protein